MSRIGLNSDAIEDWNRKLNRLCSQAADAEERLAALGRHLDPAVSARRGIDSRLYDTRSQLAATTARLKALHRFIHQSVNAYEESENQAVHTAPQPGKEAKSPAFLLWERLEREALSGIDRVGEGLQAAASDIKDTAAGLAGAWNKAVHSVEEQASRAIEAVESSAAGAFIEGAADAVTENLTFGVVSNESKTEHRVAYETGQVLGDLASEVAALAEGAAAGATEALGVGFDATGVGAIAGVSLNIAGLAIAGHAAAALGNGANHLVRDTGELVQEIRSGSSGGASKAEGAGNVKLPEMKIDNNQFGRKVGKHAEDYGLDPKNPESRQWVRNHIEDIRANSDEVRSGTWAGLGDGPANARGRGPATFYRQGNDVVVTDTQGNFVTILKDGINNTSFKTAEVLK